MATVSGVGADIRYCTNRLSISMCCIQFSPFLPSQWYLLTSQKETGKLTHAVTDQLQAHIDPFDLDMFMPYQSTNYKGARSLKHTVKYKEHAVPATLFRISTYS